MALDATVSKAIYRLESVSILPFYYLQPTLAIIIHPDRETHQGDYSYLKALQTAGAGYNARVEIFHAASALEVSDLIVKLKYDPNYNGLMIISDYGEATRRLYDMIPARLDIDGMSSGSLGRLFGATNPIAYRKAPSTPVAVMKILQELMIERNEKLEDKRIAVIGRSIKVGRPLAEILLQQNATVMMWHSRSPEPLSKFNYFDIVISAIGKPKYWNEQNLDPKGKLLIDVGINVDDKGKLCGDFDYAALKDKADYITPVPGGVGPMTTVTVFAKLFANKRFQYEDINA